MTATATNTKKAWRRALLKRLSDAEMIRKGDVKQGRRSTRQFLMDAKPENVLLIECASTTKDVVAMARELGLHCFSYKHLGSSIVFASKSEDRIGEISAFLIAES